MSELVCTQRCHLPTIRLRVRVKYGTIFAPQCIIMYRTHLIFRKQKYVRQALEPATSKARKQRTTTAPHLQFVYYGDELLLSVYIGV